jgi:hypothetical protein
MEVKVRGLKRFGCCSQEKRQEAVGKLQASAEECGCLVFSKTDSKTKSSFLLYADSCERNKDLPCLAPSLQTPPICFGSFRRDAYTTPPRRTTVFQILSTLSRYKSDANTIVHLDSLQ